MASNGGGPRRGGDRPDDGHESPYRHSSGSDYGTGYGDEPGYLPDFELPSDSALPPELNPRGQRAGRAEQRRAATAAAAAGSRADRRRAAKSKGDSVRRGAFLGAMTVAAVMSIVIVLGSGYAWYEWKGLNQNIRRVNAIPVAGANGNTAPDIDGTDQNILIVGNDDRDTATAEEKKLLGTTSDGGSYNTDTMMILHAPADGRSATIISMPRDSWVKIPGHDMAKLNAAYPYGVNDANGDKGAGARLMVETIQNLTGLRIDHYVQVDLIGFYRISNAIGGVPVNLCAAQKDSFSGLNLPAGESDVQGTQALAFVRQRHGLNGGDFDRIKRQQYFLTAAFKRISSAGVLLNPFKLKDLINAVSSSVSMDDPNVLVKLASQFSKLSATGINTQTIPNSGTGMVDGQSVVKVDPTTVQAWAKQIIAAASPTPAPTPAPTASSVDPKTITVDVLNGGPTNGAAATNAAALKAIGFTIGTVDSADSGSPSTLVKYPAGMNAQAEAVAAKVPGSSLKLSSDVTRVTLVLGMDGHAVIGVATPTPATGSSSTAPAPTVNAAATGACIN